MTVGVKFIVSVDGASASGKTTLAGALCSEFCATKLDTGLSFRAVAWRVASGIPQSEALASLGTTIRHETPRVRSSTFWDRIVIDGQDRIEEILAPELEPIIREIARDPDARAALKQYHLHIVEALPRVVVIGRDVASDLLPSSFAHVFLRASTEERYVRRVRQVLKGEHRSEVISPESARDTASFEYVKSRPNGLVVDTTSVSAAEVAARVCTFVRGLEVSSR